MKNLRYHFPTCYAYSVKEPIGELNLKRALDEDTGVFSSFFHLLLHWVRQPFLGILPFISDPGSLCLFLYLYLCITHQRDKLTYHIKDFLAFNVDGPCDGLFLVVNILLLLPLPDSVARNPRIHT